MGASKEQFIHDSDVPESPAYPIKRNITPAGMNEIFFDGITKAKMQLMADLIRIEICEGNLEAYKILAYCKYLEEQAKAIREAVLDAAISEVEKSNGSVSVAGIALKIKNAASRWDYKEIDEWVQKKDELEAIEQKAQLAWMAANSARPGESLNMVDEDGVLMVPAKKIPGKTTIEITIAK